MAREQKAEPPQAVSKSAKILYRPIGIVSSIAGGLIAGQVFKQGWKHAAPEATIKLPRRSIRE